MMNVLAFVHTVYDVDVGKKIVQTTIYLVDVRKLTINLGCSISSWCLLDRPSTGLLANTLQCLHP